MPSAANNGSSPSPPALVHCPPSRSVSTGATGVRDAAGKPRQQQQARRSKAIAAWLSSQEAGENHPSTPSFSRDGDTTEKGGEADNRTDGGRWDDGSSEGRRLCDVERRAAKEREEDQQAEDDEMEALLEAVERESGAEGKPAPEARRICCRFLLDAFRDGQFGRITLDSVPRVRRRKEAGLSASQREPQAGWAAYLTADGAEEGGTGAKERASGWPAGGKGGGAAARRKDSEQRAHPASADSDLAERLVRDWSSPDAWETPGAERG